MKMIITQDGRRYIPKDDEFMDDFTFFDTLRSKVNWRGLLNANIQNVSEVHPQQKGGTLQSEAEEA